jgi:protein phosphatase
MKINIPELALVVLIGPSGCGKSTFARTHFKPTEVLSSDFCRGLVSDDENDQSASEDAFAVLHFVAAKRLAAGKLTVIDATNVQAEDRKHLLALAREYHVLPVALVFNLPEQICHERNRHRPDRNFGSHVVRRQLSQMRRSIHDLKREGFRNFYTFYTPQQVDAAEIERQPLWNNLKQEHGPFDIIGDIHGCFDELQELLKRLSYEIEVQGEPATHFRIQHPQGRKVIFLGDLVDRGPASPSVLHLAMDMVSSNKAFCVPGNHDVKLLRKLRGKDVRITHGLAATLEQLEQEPTEFREKIISFFDNLVSHYVLDDGKLVVAHAGMKESMQGRGSRAVRDFALYGETTGETDEYGMPIRYNWAAEYRGKAMVVYGHTTVPEPEWLNRTINIDTGCVFGGKLTALRYPELQLVSVPAARTYCEPVKPFLVQTDQSSVLTAQQQHDDVLDMEDVSGKRFVTTRLHQTITIREENAIAALEVMSRFAANPKWLIYLPPTMSPCETSHEPGLLEHPTEAFAYYRHEGIEQVVCEEKHMGSRAVVIICRSEDVARQRFGVTGEGIGICYTRTGRRFFDDAALEAELLSRIRAALDVRGFWQTFSTDWVCLDCELMPWSVKAQALLLHQYAAVGAASRSALGEAVNLLEQAQAAGQDVDELLIKFRTQKQLTGQYVEAYRHYCWPVHSVADLKLAPFHILATQDEVHVHKGHAWHMDTLAQLCQADSELLLATPYKVVDVNDTASLEEGIAWWHELTDRGGEGMVVKPSDFIARGRSGLVQPAVKCRGSEYLRIIYGPEYDLPQNLERLRHRGLGRKRSLALQEFALGIEGLERFVRSEPLRRVHECVFGVLALESEPVDPRL